MEHVAPGLPGVLVRPPELGHPGLGLPPDRVVHRVQGVADRHAEQVVEQSLDRAHPVVVPVENPLAVFEHGLVVHGSIQLGEVDLVAP